MTATAAPPLAGRRSPLRNVRVLRVCAQVVFLAAVVAFLLYLWNNLRTNLEASGREATWDYLSRPAGFAIPDSDFRSSQTFRSALLVGLRNTISVAGVGIVLATILGVLVGVARLSRNWLLRRAAGLYVEAFRNVPVLVIIIFLYTAMFLQLPPIRESLEWGVASISNRGIVVLSFVAGERAGLFALAAVLGVAVAGGVAFWRNRNFVATGTLPRYTLYAGGAFLAVVGIADAALGAPVRVSLPERVDRAVEGGFRIGPEFTALLLGLVLYTASHIAEIVRGSVLAVPRGQSEAATALALTDGQRLRLVVLPQAFRIMVPPLANQYLNLTKNSSLAVFIGYVELARITSITISQGAPAPYAIALLMALYLALSLTIALFVNIVNRFFALPGH